MNFPTENLVKAITDLGIKHGFDVYHDESLKPGVSDRIHIEMPHVSICIDKDYMTVYGEIDEPIYLSKTNARLLAEVINLYSSDD